MYIVESQIVQTDSPPSIVNKQFEFESPGLPRSPELPGSPGSSNQIIAKSPPKLNYKNQNKPLPPLVPNNKKVIDDTDRENEENKNKRRLLVDKLNILPGAQTPEELAAAQLDAQNAQPNRTPKKIMENFIQQPDDNDLYL